MRIAAITRALTIFYHVRPSSSSPFPLYIFSKTGSQRRLVIVVFCRLTSRARCMIP